ncbi:hypothetical protein OCL06_14185 [Alteromonas sp. ASW11-19]|uniref:Toxin CptA n=1 Tax=Alteromonas salexigens TaxID=2982530 RepID=A0ABT2VS47_9ALTE|nr:protein YgfX [Alteromonas salexigens]MCU7555737.1 hypothetical protein [Alteromonas salexigens]
MSKFNLTVTALTPYRIDFLIPVTALLIATVAMPAPVWTWLSPWSAALMLVGLGLVAWQLPWRRHITSEQFSVDGRGLITPTAVNGNPVEPVSYVLSHQSRVTALAVYLELVAPQQPVQRRWLFRSQCHPRDFRRLTRLILSQAQSARETL